MRLHLGARPALVDPLPLAYRCGPMTSVFRFAPSPNGALHLGHARSALLNFDLARACGGRFLLRLEDIDRERCRPKFVAGMIEDLRWLGLDWEEPVWRQSERGAAYHAALDRLNERRLLYPCFATRSEIANAVAAKTSHATDPDGAPLYPGLWRGAGPAECVRRIEAGEPYALRLDMARAASETRRRAGGEIAFTEFGPSGPTRVNVHPEDWGDVVLARKEFPASYHLAVVVDDAAQGVTHVVRGRDLYLQTGMHRVLQILLGLPEPVYHHHALVLGPDGRKLAKSRKDTGIASLRARGESPDDVRATVVAKLSRGFSEIFTSPIIPDLTQP